MKKRRNHYKLRIDEIIKLFIYTTFSQDIDFRFFDKLFHSKIVLEQIENFKKIGNCYNNVMFPAFRSFKVGFLHFCPQEQKINKSGIITLQKKKR